MLPNAPDPAHVYYESQPDVTAPIALPNPTGAPAAPQALSAAVFQTQADVFKQAVQDAINALPKWQRTGSQQQLSGHGEATTVESFDPWYSDLQNWLCNQVLWDELRENLSRFLYHYARWKIAQLNGGVWGPIEFLCRFIGRSENSYALAKKYQTADGTPVLNTGELFGTPGGGWWCAPAGTIPVKKLLARWDLQQNFGGDPQGQWGQKTGIQVVYNTSTDPLKNVDLCPLTTGDNVNLINPKSPPSGHFATVILADAFDKNNAAGSRLLYISGNAAGKAVRIDEVTRVPTPPGYSYQSVAHTFNKAHSLDEESKKLASVNKKYTRNSDQTDPEGLAELKQEQGDLDAQRDAAQEKADAAVAASGGTISPTKPGTTWVVAVMRMSALQLPVFADKSASFKGLDQAALDAYMTKFELDFVSSADSLARKQRLQQSAGAAGAHP